MNNEKAQEHQAKMILKFTAAITEEKKCEENLMGSFLAVSHILVIMAFQMGGERKGGRYNNNGTRTFI